MILEISLLIIKKIKFPLYITEVLLDQQYFFLDEILQSSELELRGFVWNVMFTCWRVSFFPYRCGKYTSQGYEKRRYWIKYQSKFDKEKCECGWHIDLLSKHDWKLKKRVTLITANIVAEETSREANNPMGGSDCISLWFYWSEKKWEEIFSKRF